MRVNFVLNGRNVIFDIAPGEYLADTLRANHILSVKKACDESACGACTVLVDGRPILSCSYLSARVEGRSVTTVEAIQDEVNQISDFFSDEGADQCGFCNTGLALTIYALQKEMPNASDDEIRHFVAGNLCRCSGYQAQFLAIKHYLEAHR
ncbi:MAG TPA: 2Fe-2S iron-sulfur cluster-binding protein [Bacilli bacterium]|jgi:carbon-monoxide dehydrogenase small subunit|nr:2Fe-2S iron-sulfur cluster-binding protein [Bacilli bacterium]